MGLKKYLLFLVTLLLFFGCDSKREDVSVGFIGTLSGKYSDLGQATLQGVMLAVEEFDVDNRIKLVVKDDFGVAKEGLRIVDELAESKIKHVIGPSLSSVATAVVDSIKDKDITMVSPSASTSSLAGKDDGFMRTMPHNSHRQAKVISRYLINKLKLDETVLLYDAKNASYSNGIVKTFAEAYMQNGGKIIDIRPFNSDSTDGFGKIISQDKGKMPKLYYVVGSAIDSSLIIWQIKKAGFPSKILIRSWAASNEFYRLGGEAVEGVYLFDYYIDKSLPGYIAFRNKYQSRYKKEPAWMSVHGYECARMVIQAIYDEPKNDFRKGLFEAAADNVILKGFRFDKFGDASLPLHFFNVVGGETVHKEIAE